MLKFDLIDSAGYGYKRIYEDRDYVLRLMAAPILIKIICSLLILLIEPLQEGILRKGLVMLPAHIAEGWMIAQYMRTVFFNERWPMPIVLSEHDPRWPYMVIRAKAILASICFYVLITMAGYVLTHFAYIMQDGMAEKIEAIKAAEQAGGAARPSLGIISYIISFGVLAAAMWLFRLFWLYIPVAAGQNPLEFIKQLGGMMASIRMIGLYLVCIAPLTLIVIMLLSSIYKPYINDDAAPFLIELIGILIRTPLEAVMTMLTASAFAFAFKGIIPHPKSAFQDMEQQQ